MIGKRLRKLIRQLLLTLYILKKKEICPAYIWINLNCEKGIILLMTQNEEKGVLDYLAVKKLFTFLRGITWKHHGTFYCLNCLDSFRNGNKHKSHGKVCNNKDFCGIVMPS